MFDKLYITKIFEKNSKRLQFFIWLGYDFDSGGYC